MKYVVENGDGFYGPMTKNVAKSMARETGGATRVLKPPPRGLFHFIIEDAGDLPVRDWLRMCEDIKEDCTKFGYVVNHVWDERMKDYIFIVEFVTTEEDDETPAERARETEEHIRSYARVTVVDATAEEVEA